MRVGYSRVSDAQQLTSDPLGAARHELEKAGADQILLDVGSGRSDTARPQFRKLRELILDGQVKEVICPSQDRLGRNTELVLKFAQLCAMEGVKLLDLNGRELEVRTADGRLMTTIVAALDAHRSDLYSEKVRRHMAAAKERGFPTRSKIPFGLRKVRDDNGRFVSIELDPETAPLARQRVEWFLAGDSLVKLVNRCIEEQPDHPISRRNLATWLKSPMLTGRLCWKRNTKGDFDEVNPDPSFPALITDAQHEAIKTQLAAASMNQGLRGRETRMFTSLVRCQHCGNCLTYKTFPWSKVTYLRCSTGTCPKASRAISADQVFGVLQYAVARHAEALVPVLQRPKTDPPGVLPLREQIKVLETVPGTEQLIEQKRREIRDLMTVDTELPSWLTIAAVRSLNFWSQDDQKLNQLLRLMLDCVTVNLAQGVRTAAVSAVKFRTAPSEGLLPDDQRNAVIPKTKSDLFLEIAHHEGLAEAVEMLG